MPSTPQAIEIYPKNNLLYGPAKAATAGGVAVSGLEMSQNSYRLSWTFEKVDEELKGIMKNIVAESLAAAKEYDHGCTVVCEGATMPSTPQAIEIYQKNNLLYGPAKAANAGGVAVSVLEMSQNS